MHFRRCIEQLRNLCRKRRTNCHFHEIPKKYRWRRHTVYNIEKFTLTLEIFCTLYHQLIWILRKISNGESKISNLPRCGNIVQLSYTLPSLYMSLLKMSSAIFSCNFYCIFGTPYTRVTKNDNPLPTSVKHGAKPCIFHHLITVLGMLIYNFTLWPLRFYVESSLAILGNLKLQFGPFWRKFHIWKC